MKQLISSKLCFLGILCLTCFTCVEGAQDKSPTILKVEKNTPKLEVRRSQIGYRSTLLFYTFKNRKAVLKLQFGNRDKTFPVTGTIYVFAKNVTENGIKKWLNNQHSDGLYPDVPRPERTLKIPAKLCKVTTHKLIDHTKLPFGEYDNYAVTFSVNDYADAKNLTLKGFKGATKVHVKTK